MAAAHPPSHRLRPRGRLLAALSAIASLLALPAAAGAFEATAPGGVAFTVPATASVELGGPGGEGARAVAPLPDGSLLVAGWGSHDAAAVVRLTPSGALDPAFGTGGVALPKLSTRLLALQVLAQPDGSSIVVGEGSSLSPASTASIVLLALTPTGAVNRSFGNAGVTILGGVDVAREGAPIAALAPDGDILVAGQAGNVAHGSTPSTLHAVLARVTPQGTLDPGFGTAGIAGLPTAQAAYQPAVQGDGEVVVLLSGGPHGGSQTSLLTLTPAGAPDATIADGQPVSLPFAGWEIAAPGDGSTLVLGGFARRGSGRVARYTPAGTLDPTYAAAGIARLPANLTVGQLIARPDGTALVVGYPGAAQVLAQSTGRVVLVGLDATGQPQPSLGGAAGRQLTLPLQGGSYTAGTLANLHTGNAGDIAVAMRPDGSVAIATGVDIDQYVGEGEAYFLDSWGVAVLSVPTQPPSPPALDGTFGAPASLAATVRVASQKAAGDASGVRVTLVADHAAIADVSVSAGASSQPIASGTVALWGATPVTTRVALTPYGRRQIQGLAGKRVTVSVSLVDATAVSVHASASGRLG